MREDENRKGLEGTSCTNHLVCCAVQCNMCTYPNSLPKNTHTREEMMLVCIGTRAVHSQAVSLVPRCHSQMLPLNDAPSTHNLTRRPHLTRQLSSNRQLSFNRQLSSSSSLPISTPSPFNSFSFGPSLPPRAPPPQWNRPASQRGHPPQHPYQHQHRRSRHPHQLPPRRIA